MDFFTSCCLLKTNKGEISAQYDELYERKKKCSSQEDSYWLVIRMAEKA
jgi:hypothetical protein